MNRCARLYVFGYIILYFLGRCIFLYLPRIYRGKVTKEKFSGFSFRILRSLIFGWNLNIDPSTPIVTRFRFIRHSRAARPRSGIHTLRGVHTLTVNRNICLPAPASKVPRVATASQTRRTIASSLESKASTLRHSVRTLRVEKYTPGAPLKIQMESLRRASRLNVRRQQPHAPCYFMDERGFKWGWHIHKRWEM